MGDRNFPRFGLEMNLGGRDISYCNSLLISHVWKDLSDLDPNFVDSLNYFTQFEGQTVISGQGEMAAILLTTFSDIFCMKIAVSFLTFHWSLLLKGPINGKSSVQVFRHVIATCLPGYEWNSTVVNWFTFLYWSKVTLPLNMKISGLSDGLVQNRQQAVVCVKEYIQQPHMNIMVCQLPGNSTVCSIANWS